MLELLVLAVRWCSLPLPLSAVEGNAVSAYYYGTAVPFITNCWYSDWYSDWYGNWYSSKNSRTGYLQSAAAGGAATFATIIGKMVGYLNWILGNSKYGCSSGITANPMQVPENNTPGRSGIDSTKRMPWECSFRDVI